MAKNVLIDTSIVLDGVENVTMIDRTDNVFVTDIVLRELDGNKGAEGSKGYNAREFFRQLNGHEFKTLDNLPLTGKSVERNDTLTEGSIDSGAHVYTLSRKWYRAKDINDTKIIEMAKDYDLTLKTLDQAQSVRAKAIGLNAKVMKKGADMSYSEFNDTVYKAKGVNIKAILTIFFGVVFGLPFLVLVGFKSWAVIGVLLLIVIGVLHLVSNDDTKVEFVEYENDTAKKSLFLPLECKQSLPIKSVDLGDSSSNVYPGFSTTIGV